MRLFSEMSGKPSEIRRGVIKWAYKSIVALLVEAALLVAPSGHWNWIEAWILVGLYAIATVVQFLVMPPDLLAERSGIHKGAETWDIVLGSLVAAILPMATWIVGALDVRFGWGSSISPPLWASASSSSWWYGGSFCGP